MKLYLLQALCAIEVIQCYCIAIEAYALLVLYILISGVPKILAVFHAAKYLQFNVANSAGDKQCQCLAKPTVLEKKNLLTDVTEGLSI